MKIGDASSPQRSPVAGSKKGAAKAEGASAAAAGSQVDLSPMSARLQEIETSLANAPAMNSERVAEIRKAISEGNFKIDSSKIADGLIASVRQMLAAKTQQP